MPFNYTGVPRFIDLTPIFLKLVITMDRSCWAIACFFKFDHFSANNLANPNRRHGLLF